jgi:hypothetical protein
MTGQADGVYAGGNPPGFPQSGRFVYYLYYINLPAESIAQKCKKSIGRETLPEV